VREHTEKVKPPRALFVPFPFGSALGRAGDAEFQHRVLAAALDLLAEPSGPVLRDFPDEATDEPAAPVQASAVGVAAVTEDAAMETTRMRRYHEQWVARTGRTAVGLTRIPPARFRGVVRFLEAFAEGKEADMRERPADVPLPAFIRRCVDDLKAMYYEARMAAVPDAGGAEVARWFWGETAMGQLLRRVKERLEASDDQRMKSAGFGIAR
jgi:hypothetical protein